MTSSEKRRPFGVIHVRNMLKSVAVLRISYQTTHSQKKWRALPLHEWPLCSQTVKRPTRPLISNSVLHCIMATKGTFTEDFQATFKSLLRLLEHWHLRPLSQRTFRPLSRASLGYLNTGTYDHSHRGLSVHSEEAVLAT